MLACLWLACGLFASVLAYRRDMQKNSVIVTLHAQSAIENFTLFPNHFVYKPLPVVIKSKWPSAFLLKDFTDEGGISRSANNEIPRYMGLWKIQVENMTIENEWDEWYLPKCVVTTDVDLVKEKNWASNVGCVKESKRLTYRHNVCPTGYSEVCKQTINNGQTTNSMCCCPQGHLWYKTKKIGRGTERYPRKCQSETTSQKPEPGSNDGKSFILQSRKKEATERSEEALAILVATIGKAFSFDAGDAAKSTMLAKTSAATCGQGLVQFFLFYYFTQTGYEIMDQYNTDDFHAATRTSCSIDISNNNIEATSQMIVVTNRAILCNKYHKKECVKVCLITELPKNIDNFEPLNEIASTWQLALAGEDETLDVQTAFQDKDVWNGAHERCANR